MWPDLSWDLFARAASMRPVAWASSRRSLAHAHTGTGTQSPQATGSCHVTVGVRTGHRDAQWQPEPEVPLPRAQQPPGPGGCQWQPPSSALSLYSSCPRLMVRLLGAEGPSGVLSLLRLLVVAGALALASSCQRAAGSGSESESEPRLIRRPLPVLLRLRLAASASY